MTSLKPNCDVIIFPNRVDPIKIISSVKLSYTLFNNFIMLTFYESSLVVNSRNTGISVSRFDPLRIVLDLTHLGLSLAIFKG